MNHPHVGEILYTSDKLEYARPVKVVRVEGTTVWTVPDWVQVTGTHQGNLYDINGERKYAV